LLRRIAERERERERMNSPAMRQLNRNELGTFFFELGYVDSVKLSNQEGKALSLKPIPG
jgi:hypothetical protein